MQRRSHIASVNKRIDIEESRCSAGLAVKNYALCDQLAKEIDTLTQQRREKEAELRELAKKKEVQMVP